MSMRSYHLTFAKKFYPFIYNYMIGTALAGATAIAGQLIGGNAARKARERQLDAIEAEKQKNRNWYDRRYNEDATQRADAQRLLTRVENSIKKRNQAAAGTAAVMGGSPEVAAAARAQNNEALADVTSQIVANAEARKDAIEQQYRERDAQLAGQQMAMRAEDQMAMGQAIGQTIGTLGNIAASAFSANPAEPTKQTEIENPTT